MVINMSNYVLFSPLGMTDPTRGCRDGAFIHICRFYKPEKVYLYMSKEICQFDQKDNRYEIYLKKLCNKLDFNCEVIKIRRPELVNVHDFDIFYSDFTDIIENISNENPDSEIIVNLSSGTPQMKSALSIISSLSPRRIIQVQVSSPAGKANREQPVGEEYDIELEWELNEDNYDHSCINRCIIVTNDNFNARIKREIIEKHIKAFDYRAALAVAETISDFINPRAMELIKAGERRLALDTINAEKFAQNAEYDLLPVKGKSVSDKKRIAFEYLLVLKIKLIKGELADFLRAISPILTDLFEMYLKENCMIDIERYYSMDQNKRSAPRLSRNLLPPDLLQILDEEFSGFYRDSEPCAANLCPLIVAKGNNKARELAPKLRMIEREARNIAAHEIVTVTEDWLKQRTGFVFQDVFKMLKDFLTIIAPIPKSAWDSYERLNDAIIGMPILKYSPGSAK